MSDYIMDMIEDFGQLLQNLKEKTSHKEDISNVNHDATLGEAGILGVMLKRMCAAGKINEAENILFENLDEHPEENYFYVAMDFYEELAKLSNEKLAECDFSREEIESGLKDVISLAAENGISEDDL